MHFGDIRSTAGDDIVNLFAEYFSKMYSDRDYAVQDTLASGDANLSKFEISISSIYEKLSTLDINKGPGPDGLPPLLLKLCSFLLSRPLHIIFNLSLKTGTFPTFWKSSFIAPILKSGDRSQVSNYRPISILSCIPKVFESLVCDYLSAGLNGSFIDQQFGFLPHRSTELNLLTFTDFLLESLEEGSHVHAIYTDFTKAFDRVNHKILIKKLRDTGIWGKLLDWLTSYLTDRVQIVRILNFQSSEIKIPSGVPQGSHLGPLLFNIYVNDIASCFLFTSFLLFADDLKFYMKVQDPHDCNRIQSDLDHLAQWCDRNGMELNINKCQVMIFSRGKNPLNYVYHIKESPLLLASQIKDLGVLLDSHLSFTIHLDSIVSKSLQMLGFVKRNTKDFLNIPSIKLLYCSLVRPHLEYCSSVWSPSYNVHIQAIENVQHKFLRYIAFKKQRGVDDIIYAELENLLQITTLQVRRMHRDLTMFYNLLHSHSHGPVLTSKIGLHTPSRQTRLNHSFHVKSHRTNYGQNSFLARSARLANNFSDQIDFFQNCKTFKKQLIDCT